jgi:hypothetical protein
LLQHIHIKKIALEILSENKKIAPAIRRAPNGGHLRTAGIPNGKNTGYPHMVQQNSNKNRNFVPAEFTSPEKKKMEKIERKKSESPMQVSFSITEIV